MSAAENRNAKPLKNGPFVGSVPQVSLRCGLSLSWQTPAVLGISLLQRRGFTLLTLCRLMPVLLEKCEAGSQVAVAPACQYMRRNGIICAV